MNSETLRAVFRNQSAAAKATEYVMGPHAASRAEYLETRQRADQAIDDLNAGRSIPNLLPSRWWLSAAIGLLVGIILTLAVKSCAAAEPDQSARWAAAKINPKDSIRLDKAVSLFQRNEKTYWQITKLRETGVPPQILFCLHLRESDNNFRCSPAQGDPLTHRSVNVPRGRIPNVPPPYTFIQSAEDSYYVCDRLDTKDWWHVASALQAMELFNGAGYQHPGRPPSPYLWAATSLERPGKYVSDGRFSPTARDAQLGCAAVLLRMKQRGIALPFSP